MEPIKPTHRLVKRLVPAVAMWALGKALDSRPVRKRLERIDQRVFKARISAKQRAKRKAKNARTNAAWLAAGAAAFIGGISMMAKATRK